MVADATTADSLLRWGNYDTVTNSARFVASEVPTGLSQFSNPLPGSQNLPPSFYQPAQPSWWGSTPWPPVGPDVTGGPGPGGHAYDIPASACYKTLPPDGSNPYLKFNSNNCYGGGSAVPPPTGLAVTVH
jgi:hypothetical protein